MERKKNVACRRAPFDQIHFSFIIELYSRHELDELGLLKLNTE